MIGPFDFGRQACSMYSLTGMEAEAEMIAQADLARLAKELDRDESASDTPQETKVFTVHLEFVPRRRELVALHFPWDNADLLAKTMKATVEGLYATRGKDRIEEFHQSVYYDRRIHQDYPGAGPTGPGYTSNAVAFESFAEATKAGGRVVVAAETALRELEDRKDVALKSVEAAAATLALGRLNKADQEIAGEAPRYLSVKNRQSPDVNDPYVRYPEDLVLDGPDADDLLDALRDLHRARRRLEAAAADFANKVASLGAWPQAVLNPKGGPFGPAPPQEVAAIAATAYPEVAQALQSATVDLALMLTVYGRSFPILFRVWDGPWYYGFLPFPAELPEDLTTPAGQQALNAIKQTIWVTLRETWTAKNALVARIEGDSRLVWRYPATVSMALDALGYLSPSVEFQAAQERMADEHGTPLAAKLYMVTGTVQMGAALAGAEPPVGVVLACIAFAAGAYDKVQELRRLLQQEEASKAVLDPSMALASEPEYRDFLAGVAFSVLDLKGVHDAVAAWRVAAEVSTAKKAVDIAAPLQTIPREPLSSVLVPALARSHGAVVRPFEPLLRRFGAEVAPDIVALEHTIANGNLATLDEAWTSVGNLEQKLRRLTGDERLRVGLELEYRRQALQALDKEFTALWAQDAKDSILALRQKSAAKAAAKAIAGEKLSAGAVDAWLIRYLSKPETDQALVKLWRQFSVVVPELSPFMRKASEYSAANVQAVWKIMQTEGVVAGRARLMGYVINVRSALGEGYALGNSVVRADIAKELALGNEAAARLNKLVGPGHEAHYLTQAEHGIRLNMPSGEGPDAGVWIINRELGTAYTKTGVQIKIADDSEAVEQTIKDLFREAGIENVFGEAAAVKKAAEPVARIEFRLPGESEPTSFVLTTSPLVERRSIIINASGSKISPTDTALLEALGFRVDEHVLDMSVAQFTHLAVSKLAASLEAAHDSGLLQKLTGVMP